MPTRNARLDASRMKQLILITVCGGAAVLLVVFAAYAGFNILHGRPIAHATGIWAIGLRYLLTGAAVLAVVIGYALWYWVDFWYVRSAWRS